MLAGSVTFNNLEHYEKQRMFRTFSGSNQSAFDSVLLVRSLRTLKVRYVHTLRVDLYMQSC